jgi:PDZ domain
MIYAFIGLLGIAALVVLNGTAVLVGRRIAARFFGLRGTKLWSLRPSPKGPALSPWKQALFVAAGFSAAYLVAGCLYASALLANGRTIVDSEDLGTRVTPVPGMAAESAGVQNGDQIVTVASEPLARWAELVSLLRRHASQTVDLGLKRGSQELTVTIRISPEGRIGVAAFPEKRAIGLIEAVGDGFASPWKTARDALRAIVGDTLPVPVAGPVALAAEAPASERHLHALSFFASLNGTYGLLFAFIFALLTRVRAGSEAATLKRP